MAAKKHKRNTPRSRRITKRRRNVIRSAAAKRITAVDARNTSELTRNTSAAVRGPQLGLPHVVKKSRNAEEREQGNMPVVSVRFTRSVLEGLDMLAAKRNAEKSWPRTTRSGLVYDAVVALLKQEAV